jgi:signal transduction histidine kinase
MHPRARRAGKPAAGSDAAGGPAFGSVAIVTIRELESAVAPDKTLWTDVLDAVSDSIVVVDGDTIAFANVAYRGTFGDAAFVVVDDLGREVPPHERPQVRAARDEPAEGDFVVQMPTGEKRVFYITARRLPDGTRVAVQLHDVSEEQRLQDQFLERARQKLHKPLARLRGAIESLPSDDDSTRAGLTEAFAALQELDRFVDRLRALATLPVNRFALRLERTNFATVVSRAVASARRATPDRGYDFRLDAGQLYVQCDAPRVEEVIHELLVNANEHAAPGEKVYVHVTRVDRYAVLEVRDRGDIIPAGDIARIFSRFQQVLCPDESAGSGLGVSLYVSSEVIRAHGGTVTAESRETEGTVFTVRLPILDAEAT